MCNKAHCLSVITSNISVASRAHSACYSTMAGVKWPGNEFNYSPSSNVKVKDVYSYTAVPLCAFTACMGTNLPFFILCYLLCCDYTEMAGCL